MALTASPCRQIAPAPSRDYWPPIPQRRDNFYGRIEHHFELIGIDQDSVIILPDTYEYGFDRTDDKQWNEGTFAWKARKTCKVYEDLFKSPSPHPRIAEYIGRHPENELPLLKKPSGPPLECFTAHNHEMIYMEPRESASALTCRVRLLSVLEFSHSHDLILGYFDDSNLWLSSNLSISLVGFTAARWTGYTSQIHGEYPFMPTYPVGNEYIRTSKATDLFCYGNSVYGMMTDFFPGGGLGLSPDQIHNMYARGEFPPIERQYLGEIAAKCWHYKYENVQDLKEDVLKFLQEEGWEVDGDMLKGFGATELFQGRIRESCPDYINEDDDRESERLIVDE